MAFVRRAQEIKAVLVGFEEGFEGLVGAVGRGTSQSGVMRDRPERRRRKVKPRPVDLRVVQKEGEGERDQCASVRSSIMDRKKERMREKDD